MPSSALIQKAREFLARNPRPPKQRKASWYTKQKSGGILLYSAKSKTIGYLQPADAAKFEKEIVRRLAYSAKALAALIEEFFSLTGKQPSDRS